VSPTLYTIYRFLPLLYIQYRLPESPSAHYRKMAEKDGHIGAGLHPSDSPPPEKLRDSDDEGEIFQKTGHGVDFRTVTWQKASIVFLKILFATGVLSIPAAMYALGAAPGALLILAFGMVNTYVGRIQGNFRNMHPGCHSVADMAAYLGGPILKELVGGLFVVA
jgi:hypothetical protein